jgi:hypothetical protein
VFPLSHIKNNKIIWVDDFSKGRIGEDSVWRFGIVSVPVYHAGIHEATIGLSVADIEAPIPVYFNIPVNFVPDHQVESGPAQPRHIVNGIKGYVKIIIGPYRDRLELPGGTGRQGQKKDKNDWFFHPIAFLKISKKLLDVKSSQFFKLFFLHYDNRFILRIHGLEYNPVFFFKKLFHGGLIPDFCQNEVTVFYKFVRLDQRQIAFL